MNKYGITTLKAEKVRYENLVKYSQGTIDGLIAAGDSKIAIKIQGNRIAYELLLNAVEKLLKEVEEIEIKDK